MYAHERLLIFAVTIYLLNDFTSDTKHTHFIWLCCFDIQQPKWRDTYHQLSFKTINKRSIVLTEMYRQCRRWLQYVFPLPLVRLCVYETAFRSLLIDEILAWSVNVTWFSIIQYWNKRPCFTWYVIYVTVSRPLMDLDKVLSPIWLSQYWMVITQPDHPNTSNSGVSEFSVNLINILYVTLSIILNERLCILLQISLELVPEDSKSACTSNDNDKTGEKPFPRPIQMAKLYNSTWCLYH